MRATVGLVFILTLSGVGAGAAQTAGSGPPVRTRMMPPVIAEAGRDYALRRFERPGVTAAQASAVISNKTRLVNSPGTPPQVVFAASDGRIFLWFPSSGEVRRGRWHIEERVWELRQGGVAVKKHVQATICFDYSGGVLSMFASEGRRGSACLNPDFVQRTTIDRRDGDIFRLASGQARRPIGRVQPRKLSELGM